MTLFLNEDDVRQVATMAMALEAVEGAFAGLGQGETQARPRQRVRLANGVLHNLIGGVPSSHALGLKAYASYPSGTRFIVLLFDSDNGDLLSIMEADRLGQLRTGAASGVATRYLAREDARVLGQIGAGWQSRTQMEAVCAVRPIEQVRVYSRDKQRREAYCREMSQQLRIEVVPVENGAAVVKGADVLTTITNSSEPVLFGEWLEPGQHINAAGSNWAQRRELDVEAVRRAEVITADYVEQAKIESGDLVAAVEAGAIGWDQVIEIGDVVAGKRPGRGSSELITLFESQGLGVEDVATAAQVYQAARARGLGREIEVLGRIKDQRRKTKDR
jgi:ornithine cyclodeaminase